MMQAEYCVTHTETIPASRHYPSSCRSNGISTLHLRIIADFYSISFWRSTNPLRETTPAASFDLGTNQKQMKTLRKTAMQNWLLGVF